VDYVANPGKQKSDEQENRNPRIRRSAGQKNKQGRKDGQVVDLKKKRAREKAL